MKSPDAIICSDIHARYSTPTCRTDDFLETQKRKWRWLKKLQKKHGCPVLCAGDIFHRAKAATPLHYQLIKNIPFLYTVAGNHDLPSHSSSLLHESSLGILEVTKRVEVLSEERYFNDFVVWGFNYSDQLKNIENEFPLIRTVAILHAFTYDRKKPWPGCVGYSSRQLMKKLSNFDLIITGDNHNPFVRKKGNQILVNPGSFTRQTADQMDHKPRVYLWWAEENKIKPVYVPIEKNVMSRDHLEEIEVRNEKIELFIKKLKNNAELGVDFNTNIKHTIEKTKVHKLVRRKVMEAVNGTN